MDWVFRVACYIHITHLDFCRGSWDAGDWNGLGVRKHDCFFISIYNARETLHKNPIYIVAILSNWIETVEFFFPMDVHRQIAPNAPPKFDGRKRNSIGVQPHSKSRFTNATGGI